MLAQAKQLLSEIVLAAGVVADFIHMVRAKAEAASMAKAGAKVASMDQHPNQTTLVVVT